MIVNYTQDGWEIITQRSHGLLAAQICAKWKTEYRPKRWVDTIIATAEHDDVFNEPEKGPLISAVGGPVNYKMNVFNLELCELLIQRAEMKGCFVALLIAKYISFTHGKETKARNFLSKLNKRRKKWMAICSARSSEVDRAYQLLEFCDAFSLLICQQMIPPEARLEEISTGPENRPYSVFQKENRLVVTPWPFESPSFTVAYEKRLVRELKFSSDEDFRKSLRLADPQEVKVLIAYR